MGCVYGMVSGAWEETVSKMIHSYDCYVWIHDDIGVQEGFGWGSPL